MLLKNYIPVCIRYACICGKYLSQRTLYVMYRIHVFSENDIKEEINLMSIKDHIKRQ